MSNDKPEKSCGTCRFWGEEPFFDLHGRDTGERECKYPLPKLPAWAAAGAPYFGNWNRDYEGKDCEVWAEKDEETKP